MSLLYYVLKYKWQIYQDSLLFEFSVMMNGPYDKYNYIYSLFIENTKIQRNMIYKNIQFTKIILSSLTKVNNTNNKQILYYFIFSIKNILFGSLIFVKRF